MTLLLLFITLYCLFNTLDGNLKRSVLGDVTNTVHGRTSRGDVASTVLGGASQANSWVYL